MKLFYLSEVFGLARTNCKDPLAQQQLLRAEAVWFGLWLTLLTGLKRSHPESFNMFLSMFS